MLQVYATRGGALQPVESPPDALPADALWIDLIDPVPEEDRQVERWLGIAVPTREEMQEIEHSSRLYEERGALYMTALVIWRADTLEPSNTPVTFILAPRHLVTVRYADPQPFRTFLARCAKQPEKITQANSAFIALLEAVVDRAADLLERAGADLDGLSGGVFRPENTGRSGLRRSTRRPADLQALILRIGQDNDLVSKIHESLLSLARLLIFFGETGGKRLPEELRPRLKTLSRDVRSLNEHAVSLSNKVLFLLDATLGLVNIQQNAIIKIFSVVAVIFMPPTLVASIYGMNFEFMPELHWEHGYAWALLLMVGSGVLPYLYFKFRNWL
jgi:magnesium transporter